MDACWNCQTQLQDEVNICPHCGAIKPTKGKNDSTLIVKKVVQASSPNDPQSAQKTLITTELALKIAAETLVVPLTKRVVLGRGAQTSTDFTFVDLSRFDAAKLGISRNHADLRRIGTNNVVIIDMRSTNGTRIFDEKLTPFKAYPLNHSDHIYLGNLCIVVNLSGISLRVT
jgi:pSer/pThr/pTyr-binding forkhead associated (FHA) protein